MFNCIALQLPDAAATVSSIRNIVYIIIDVSCFQNPQQLNERMKTVNWDVLPSAVARQFPHLGRIIVQSLDLMYQFPRELLVEFVAHLGEAWTSLGSMLELYHYARVDERMEFVWARVQLDAVMRETKYRVCMMFFSIVLFVIC